MAARNSRGGPRYAPLCHGQICDEVFVPLGTRAFGDVVRRVERQRADAVLMLLVGQDAVEFNRAFAAAGLQDGCRRLSTLIEENTLLASGADSTAGHLRDRRLLRVAPHAGEHGLRPALRAPLRGRRADAQQPGRVVLRGHPPPRGAGPFGAHARRRRLCAVADGVSYAGPRGEVGLRDQHLDQRVYLAEADALDLGVIAELQPVAAG